MMKRNTWKCPHCGNADPKFMDDNGERPGNPDFTLLCTKPCAPSDNSFNGDASYPYCAMQWEPNQEDA